MPRITVDLLRRRAEHNEGVLSTLEEITLHQQDIEAIELVGDACRNLQILYLQNNLIRKIENLQHLKQLWYLNLAINSIQVIEGLEGCENLKKLDLTLNFVADITSVRSLRKNARLECLYLTGNPCTEVEGYRAYVIQQLPHLITLDGVDVKRSEMIKATQDAEVVDESWRMEAQRVAEDRHEYERKKKEGTLDPPKYNEKGERLYGNTPDEREACYKDMQEKIDKAKNPPKDPNSISAIWEENEKLTKPRKLTPEEEVQKYGRVLQKNEGKLPYKLWEDKENVYLEVQPGKFISTSVIKVDIQPEYARVEVKDKVLQVLLPSEVSPSQSKVKRGTAKGELLLTMPIVGDFKGVTDLRMPKREPVKKEDTAKEKPMEPLKRDALMGFESPVEAKDGSIREARKHGKIEELE
eukprot:TRINITY_DN16869_c0_g1_i1.p1 TRINITY_DN16869_c0_g1~~TRINITY_DN16869_c0_g1_i1.p1  ORF type:complete len:421 (+),score=144.51 TRINITY_DN16869_c0_g1_i1:31-1263(+)